MNKEFVFYVVKRKFIDGEWYEQKTKFDNFDNMVEFLRNLPSGTYSVSWFDKN